MSTNLQLMFIWQFYSFLPCKKAPDLYQIVRIILCAKSSLSHSAVFFIWFRSGLWLGHSKTSIFFFWSHSFVYLDLCFGTLLCWKVKFLHLQLSNRVCAKLDQHLKLYMIPSILIIAPVSAKEKQPYSMMLPPPWFIVSMVSFRQEAVLLLSEPLKR